MSTFPPDVEEFIQSKLASGKYANRADVLTAAVRWSRKRDQRRQEMLQRIRAIAQVGIDAIERGVCDEMDGDALNRYFEELIEGFPDAEPTIVSSTTP